MVLLFQNEEVLQFNQLLDHPDVNLLGKTEAPLDTSEASRNLID
jgi:hypothetical protein